MFTGILSAGVTTHVPNFVTSVAQDGGSLQGTILSVYSIVSIIGMVAGGALMDKIGIRKTVLGATDSGNHRTRKLICIFCNRYYSNRIWIFYLLRNCNVPA